MNTTLRVYLIVHDWKQIRVYWCKDRLSRHLVLTQEVQWHAKGVIYKTIIITLQINIVMFQTNIIYTRKNIVYTVDKHCHTPDGTSFLLCCSH